MSTIGSIEWTERTGGILTARECVSLAGPLVRDELRIAVGLRAQEPVSGRPDWRAAGAQPPISSGFVPCPGSRNRCSGSASPSSSSACSRSQWRLRVRVVELVSLGC
jgi:hypothetical protein